MTRFIYSWWEDVPAKELREFFERSDTGAMSPSESLLFLDTPAFAYDEIVSRIKVDAEAVRCIDAREWIGFVPFRTRGFAIELAKRVVSTLDGFMLSNSLMRVFAARMSRLAYVTSPDVCPDTGRCHHGCKSANGCSRVASQCVPLSVAAPWLNDAWKVAGSLAVAGPVFEVRLYDKPAEPKTLSPAAMSKKLEDETARANREHAKRVEVETTLGRVVDDAIRRIHTLEDAMRQHGVPIPEADGPG